MTVKCAHCKSAHVVQRGTRVSPSGEHLQRYKCRDDDCGKWFTGKPHKFMSPSIATKSKRIVISGVQNDAEVNQEFYGALMKYCEINRAELILVPITYRNGNKDEPYWHIPEDQLTRTSLTICKKLRLLGDINISPTIENPTAGLDYLSKGDSLLIAHPQLQMKTLAVNSVDSPAIISTTGVITKPTYSKTKVGAKGLFNHSYSAVVIEIDPSVGFHYRVLNADDDNGFYDVSGYYTAKGRTNIDRIEALITGDEHAMFIDPDVKAATYTDADSIVNTLRPKKIVRHDILDFFSGSHHHQKSFLTKFAKYKMKTNIIEDELTLTLKHIADTTPKNTDNVIVASNHNEHLHQWLDTVDVKYEVWNAKLYHRLMFLMLDNMKEEGKAFSYPNVFKLWVEETDHKFKVPSLQFLSRNTTYKIGGIELSNHGDMGINGARGSASQFSRLAHKMVVGHTHSPSIMKGAYTVGTSTGRLEYARGPSGWMNTHCIVYPNHKRQLINIINGRWKL